MAGQAELVTVRPRRWTTSQEIVQHSNSRELFFAVVGHIGSGTSEVAQQLRGVLSSDAAGPAYDAEILKARAELEAWDARHRGILRAESRPNKLEVTELLQQIGNDMRVHDHAAVARAFIRKIRETRARKTGRDPSDEGAVHPDGKPRAYVLDSIRHPAEVELLARLYQDAFVLIGVVCDEPTRLHRLQNDKLKDAASRAEIEKLMKRDAKEGPKHGQRVSDAFHLAHYFLDNTEDRKREDGTANPEWDLVEQLTRLKKILTHSDVMRPHVSETAMFAAHGAKVRSACISRQVGASIVNDQGEVVSLGTNEVPQAGGGVYGSDELDPEASDGRCVYSRGYCSNTREQDDIIAQIMESLNGVIKDDVSSERLAKTLRSSPIGSLLEFSRAVHAEMDAVLGLVRRGLSARETRVFVTTFPCHYCARHLVAAGVSEVQYIEPYPKSKALVLHSDAITTRVSEWRGDRTMTKDRTDERSKRKGRVLFRPFVGVAPRLYPMAFLKTRELKDEQGKFVIGPLEWTEPTHLGRMSYTELEAQLAREDQA
jgi:deoxycytidylate deaminase